MKALITGNSSGLGLGLTRVLLHQGGEVWGCSRRGCPIDSPSLHDQHLNLAEPEQIASALEQLLGNTGQLDLVVLNAGVLGDIRLLSQTALPEIYEVMDINVWANKIILDWLIEHQISVAQLIMISSGAAVRGNKGWGAYALSKATLNMLAQLYAHEMPDSHVLALAPGLVDTAMQDYLGDNNIVDEALYPSVKALRDARGTDAMPSPEQVALMIINLLPVLAQDYPSGSFVDIRNLS